MKKSIVFLMLVFMLLALGNELFAFGRKQEEKKDPVNPEWTLIITEFDTSAMSPAWQTAGDTITRNLVATLLNMSSRLIGEEEYTFHRDTAWRKSRTTAAAALARRRNERDQLIFRGDPSWRYERALRTANEDILKLEKELAAIDAASPLVEQITAVRLHQRNIDGVFPPPPEPGRENRFCAEHNVDAFISGRLSEFHGRIFLEMEMYTRHTASFSHEDLVLFSTEDFDTVLSEITERMVMMVSGVYPSTIAVHATPPEAMVLIDGVFVGHGEVEHSLFPGDAEISIQADNYAPVSFPLTLEAGELAEIYINLTPLGRNAFEADTSNRPGSRVFRGSLFVGETPLTLEVSENEFAYVTVETVDGEIGSVIYRDNSIIGGSAQFVRVDANHGRADFITAPPVPEEEKRVSRIRNAFYSTYGALWFALPSGLITAGIAGTYIAANNHIISNNLFFNDSETRSRMSANASVASAVTTGAYGVIGAVLGATFFQIYRYIRASGREAAPLTRPIEPGLALLEDDNDDDNEGEE